VELGKLTDDVNFAERLSEESVGQEEVHNQRESTQRSDDTLRCQGKRSKLHEG
jgi:hypothetical protein